MNCKISYHAPSFIPEITPPASKSLSNRALLLSALVGDMSLVENAAVCDDTQVMKAALIGSDNNEIDVHGAGTAMRFLTAYYSLFPERRIITGSARMRQRPIGILADALRQLGADIVYTGREGFPPLRVGGGKMHGGEVTLPASVSSQYISALLMVGPMLEDGLTLRLTGKVASRPYIDMTLSLMRYFGAAACWEGERKIRVESGHYAARRYVVESDWSAASYWYEIAALSRGRAGVITLKGLNEKSLQGDSAVASLFENLGTATEYTGEGIRIISGVYAPAESLERDLNAVPDLAQTLIATCCGLGVKFRFSGLGNLKVKETDRIQAMETEMAKLGYRITDDSKGTVCWDGSITTTAEPAPQISTYDDHRMAMSIAPLAMIRGEMVIKDPSVVKKSYPGYWSDIEKAGFETRKEEEK